jgi:hypothetical protein
MRSKTNSKRICPPTVMKIRKISISLQQANSYGVCC